MFSHLKKILNVNRIFRVFNGVLYYQESNANECFLIEEFGTEGNVKVAVKNRLREVFALGESQLFVHDDNGQLFLVKDGLELSLVNAEYQFNCQHGLGNQTLCYKGGLFSLRHGVYSFLENRVLFESDTSLGDIICDNAIYGEQDNQITCRKLQGGQVLWEYDLHQKEGFKISLNDKELTSIQLSNFLGVYQGNVWFALNNGFLLGLNTKTGEEVAYVGVSFNNDDESDRFLHLGHAFISSFYKLDSENGKVLLLTGRDFFEVDLNQEVYMKQWVDMSEFLSSSNVQCDMGGSEGFIFDDSFYYFYDGVQGKIVVLDRQSFEIVWMENIQVQTTDSFVLSLFKNMRVFDDKLCVLDRNDTLHIFERDPASARSMSLS